MTRDTLIFGEEARQRLINGIYKCKEAVGGTMGTGGANSILEAMENPGHRITNDGATILEAIRLADPVEEMGRRILLEAVSRSNKASGDGSSTTTVLTAAILDEGMKRLTEQTPMEIKRSLEACIPLIEEKIQKQARTIDVTEVGAVAAISAEDASIGEKIQEIYAQIGKSGIIQWDVSKTGEDYYTLGRGINVEGAKIVSPYMFDYADDGRIHPQATFKNVAVLVTKEKITTAEVFNSLFDSLYKAVKSEVLIICDEYEAPVVAQLVQTRIQRGFRTALVQLPTYFKDEWFEDLALASGATVISATAGLSLRNCKPEHLGTFGNVTIKKEDMVVDGIKDLAGHLASLEAEGTEGAALRASRLNTKTARYFVGGLSDSAISHRRYKVEDAIAAAYHALHGGIVIGGGIPLAEMELPNPILEKALQAPLEQIRRNMSRTYSREELEEKKVYDPAQIVINSVKNAISVAANVLTCSTLVLLPSHD
jgi:chaperonin GroEL